ncbi:hypothetical protein [Confluentibacter lentus]|uniref:hypothetical protein n=1 Tax=Confluentibacter lentus TaxID=1699412 RepID=UPI001E58B200|nr:hypothetical protein [Confluentibacter lentus]
MKLYFSFFVFLFFVASMDAQIDSRNNSISIPAIESPKDSSDSKSLLPSKPIEAQNTNKGLSTPKTNTQFNFPKKEFSMTGGEVFGNPGELYTKQLDKHLQSTRLLTPEEVEQRNGSRTDQFFGDFKSKSKFVNIAYRDHGAVDGDLIQVRVNDDVVQARVFLTNNFSGLKLDLKPGINKIDFVALNQGESGPNTAEFIVIDDAGNVVSSNQWNLATGVKATIIVVKE